MVRPIDELFLRKLVEEHAPILWEVRPRGHPGDHIVPILGRERSHEHIFELVAARKLCQYIVWLHCLNLARVFLLGSRPQILSVIENLRIRHMEGPVLVSLDREQILRIAQVLLQIGGEIAEVAEHVGESFSVRSQNRVLGIHDEKAHVPVIHVHNDLHGVSDVIQTIEGRQRMSFGSLWIGASRTSRKSVVDARIKRRLIGPRMFWICVGIVIGCRIGVLDPI